MANNPATTRKRHPFPPARGGRPQWPVLCTLHKAGLDWAEMAPHLSSHGLAFAKVKYERLSKDWKPGALALRDARDFVLMAGINRKLKWPDQ